MAGLKVTYRGAHESVHTLNDVRSTDYPTAQSMKTDNAEVSLWSEPSAGGSMIAWFDRHAVIKIEAI